MIDYKIASIQTTDESDRVKVRYRVYEGEERNIDKEDPLTGKTSQVKQYQRDRLLVQEAEMVIHAKGEKAIHEAIKTRLAAQMKALWPDKTPIKEQADAKG